MGFVCLFVFGFVLVFDELVVDYLTAHHWGNPRLWFLKAKYQRPVTVPDSITTRTEFATFTYSTSTSPYNLIRGIKEGVGSMS